MTRDEYSPAAKVLHWMIVVLIAAQFAVAWSMPHIGRNTRPDALINLHFSLGVAILAVMLVRLIYRVAAGAPVAAALPALGVMARITHWLLYALLVVLPVLGWMNASWRGFPVALFGLELPKLMATRLPGWNWTGDVHAVLSNYVLLTLVVLHILAALYHHFVLRDKVLKSML
ncbi:MAG TPA: cytochrome b/b6 domain-containing protein [Burkholderiales bacterium]|nr:cytochrome b/b6 domain-containing protein [Burkholderiales bacterium]